jgi:dipeptidyl aminopeptidase/acylaminoacyl peptidase
MRSVLTDCIAIIDQLDVTDRTGSFVMPSNSLASSLRRGITIIALGIATSASAQAPAEAPAAAAVAPVRYTAAQFFETTAYNVAESSRHAFSPDGRFVLISSNRTGTFNVYALPVAGGDPVALTSSTTNAMYAVGYFPRDERVLITGDTGGNELDHIYVRTPDGTLRDLTPGDNLKAMFGGFSADGTTFWVMTNERDPAAFDVYAYDTTSYERRMIFRNPGGFSPAAMSADGARIALSKELTSADSDIYLATAGSDAAPTIVATSENANVAHNAYAFTPDGQQLIYATDAHGEFAQAWSYTLDGGARAPLLTADWDVSYIDYSPSGRYRVQALNADGSTALTVIDTRTGQPVALTSVPSGDLGGVRFSNDENSIAFTVISDTSPRNIFVATLADGAARRLTNALNPAMDEARLVEASVARFASYDGLQIPGILYRPHEASATNPVPAIVLVHGGPGGQSRRGYSSMVQHLVNHGFAVYAINNRGSSGYGKTFFHLDDRRHGDVDLRDVTAARDWLAGQDWISDRVAVMGGSYGGYMTAAALAFHPETFDAGVNIFGVTNWVRTLESIPAWWGAGRTALFDEMGDPATDGVRLRAISPLFHASNIRRPLLVVQGANDPRVLQVESDELVAAVRVNNIPVDYVLFPDEGHGFQRRENNITASEAYVAFLNRHLRR